MGSLTWNRSAVGAIPSPYVRFCPTGLTWDPYTKQCVKMQAPRRLLSLYGAPVLGLPKGGAPPSPYPPNLIRWDLRGVPGKLEWLGGAW